MTNENEAPERIWAWETLNRSGQWAIGDGWGVEYIRADLSDAKDKRIEKLEAQNRELHMQVIASDSQAQMAYEEQEKLEAELTQKVEQYRLVGMDKINLVARVAELEALVDQKSNGETE